MKIDALQKYQNQLLSAFNAEQLQYLKYDNWTGLLTETDRLYATMFHDWDVLQKDSSDLAEAVQSLEWTVAPYVADGKEADAKAQEVAKTVTDALWKRSSKHPGTYSHTFPQLLNALVHALFRGFNVHEIEWVNDGELVYPAAFHQLPPQFMRWEDRAGELDRLLFVADGETAKPKPFPANKYIVALNTSGPDHPLYNAMYYSLIAWYGAYKFGLGWFMEYCQKYGMPKLVFHYESDRDRQQLEADLAEERVLNNILLKGDRAVDIANAPASGASLPQRELLNLAESQCHKLILGQTLTSDTSEHGGSLAQARVHAGVQAEVVKKRATFVADVLNTQLIPAIVLLNYGTMDVPMPELVFKLPQEGVTLERVQVLKTALEIKGMRIKKSEAYEFMGFAQPAEGDDVFEAASETPQQGGFGAMFGQQPPPGGKALQKGQQKPDEGKKDDAVSAMNADFIESANPYGCNQYGHEWKSKHGENWKPSGRGVNEKQGEKNTENKEPSLQDLQAEIDNLKKMIDVFKKVNSDVATTSRTDAPTDPAQEWLAPIKQKFLEARKAGASMADLKKMLLTMHPDTKALAKAFANNILAGFAGESEEVDAANPWGCNQYGHRKGHKGGESKRKESDDVYDFDNMEPDERLQQAIDDLGEVEEEDINWDDFDKAQEVKKIFHPDNHKVAQWRKERMINEVGNRVTDALRHLANVNKASRDFRNPNRPTEDDVARAEEAFGKAVHEWRRFHRARLEVQGWDKKAIDGYLSRWPEYMETANSFPRADDDSVTAASSDDDSRRRKEPIPQPDGTKCYTEDCKKHEDKTRQTTNNNVEYAHDDNSRTGGRSEEKRSGGALQRAGQASSHSEQGGDKENGRQLGQRVLLPESVKRSVQKSLRSLGIEDEEAEKRLTLTTTAQVQAVLEGRKPAFLEPFQELVEDIYSTLPHDENIRYVAGKVEYCIYNAESVRNVLSSSASGSELDSIVKGLIDDSKSGVILGYGYNFLDNPRGWNVLITANGEEISGFDAPPDITESEYYASERTEDFRRAFPDMEWSFRIKE